MYVRMYKNGVLAIQIDSDQTKYVYKIGKVKMKCQKF